MKKKITIALYLMAMTTIIAPNLCTAQIEVGLRGGLNATNISFKNLPERSEQYGYHIGMFLDIGIVPAFFGIQPEISFSTKGTDYKYLGEKRSIKLNTVDLLLPVAFKLSVVDLTVGPFVSFLINTPVYTQYTDNSVILNGFKKVDAGLTAGLRFNISKVFLGVRYNQGLMEVGKENLISALGSGKNAVGQVSLGFKF
jgi:Outer membrane protein beta-barrel domain